MTLYLSCNAIIDWTAGRGALFGIRHLGYADPVRDGTRCNGARAIPQRDEIEWLSYLSALGRQSVLGRGPGRKAGADVDELSCDPRF